MSGSSRGLQFLACSWTTCCTCSARRAFVSWEVAVWFFSGSTEEKGFAFGFGWLVSCSKHARASSAHCCTCQKLARSPEGAYCIASSSGMGTFVNLSQSKPCMLPALLLVLGADAAAGIGAVAACLPGGPGAGTGTTGDSVLGTSFGDDMLGPGGGCIGLLGMLNLNAFACKSEPDL